jgi:hypothetical protein
MKNVEATPLQAGRESPQNQAPGGEQPLFSIDVSRQFVNWIAEQGVSLGLTTYQSGKIFLLGHRPFPGSPL